ncbi:hypothetical protein GC170_22195 [bacterium]|nr:hypothetical protein [bacterium]
MKTNRPMTRTLGLLALGLFAALTATEALADSMLPRYRLEDLGPAEEYLGASPILFEDGSVDKYSNPSGKEYLRHGEYTYLNISVGGHPIEHVLKRDGSDVNLMSGVNPDDIRFLDFNAKGQYLAYNRQTSTDIAREYVFDTTTSTKTFVNLSGLDGVSQRVLGLNSEGNLVGYATLPGGVLGATFYQSATTEAILLNTLVDGASNFWLETAGDINDAGEIVGIGYDPSNPWAGGRAYKLVPITPVPEPSTWLIFAACGIWAGRKKFSTSIAGKKNRTF